MEKNAMNLNDRNYPMLESIDNLEKKHHHSMLLYKNPQYATLVINRYIENGLQKGEHTIYITHDDVDQLEKEIASTGVDVDYFKKKNLLHIYQIENIMETEGGLEAGYNDLLKKLTADAKPPYRFVGRTIPNVSTNEGIKAELVIENLFHSHFDNYNCSFMCPYNVKDIEKDMRPKWIHQLIKNHHNLIFASEPANSVTFQTDLLKSI